MGLYKEKTAELPMDEPTVCSAFFVFGNSLREEKVSESSGLRAGVAKNKESHLLTIRKREDL